MLSQGLSSDLLGGAAAPDAHAAAGAAPRKRSVQKQVEVLVKKQLAMKMRNWRWTLLEWVFPLQGILFLWLMFNLGNLVLPFEKVETAAQSFAPENLLNASLLPSWASCTSAGPGLLGLMHIGGTVAIAPAAPDDEAAARAVYSVFCGAYDAMRASTEYQEAIRSIEAAVQAGGDGPSACDTYGATSMECSIIRVTIRSLRRKWPTISAYASTSIWMSTVVVPRRKP